MTQDMTNPAVRERLMTAIAVERDRLASRRGFLRNAAKVAGGGAIALAAMPATGSMRAVLAQGEDFADDLEILNFALTLEHLENAFYRDGLATFSEDDFAGIGEDDEDETSEDDEEDETSEDDEDAESEEAEESDDDDGAEIFSRLEVIRDHEQGHVDVLTQTITDLGGEPVSEGEYDFGYGDDPVAFLEIAQALENTGVSAYAGAGPQIQDRGLVAAALSILSVEARHAGYLNDLNGELPFPDTFDKALTRDEVLEIAGEFIIDDGSSDDEEPTEEVAADGEATEEVADGEATEAPADGEATEAPADGEATEAPAATDPPAATEEPTEEPATEEPTEETEDDVDVPEATETP